jgi:hypothetical protein
VDNESKRYERLESLIKEIAAYPHDKKVQMLMDNPLNIGMIIDPSEELQMIAINRNPAALDWINNPTESVTLMAKLLS